MRTLIVLLASVLLFSPITADAQDSRAALEAASKALGATGLKSIEIQGGGTVFQVGQSYTAGTAWPEFNVRSFTRVVNYDTASLRDDILRTRALEPPKGAARTFAVSTSWSSSSQRRPRLERDGRSGDAGADCAGGRQFQLWSTPHGVIKAALAGKGTLQGRTIAFGVPGSFKATATLDAVNLVERVEGTMTNPVLGDMAVTVSYADYRDFGGVKFPTKIRQSYGGFPALELTVTEVKPNAAAETRCRTPSGRRPIPTCASRARRPPMACGT